MEYMSQEGYDRLVAELRQLERVELPKVIEAIAEARDKGDLSENFEYHAATNVDNGMRMSYVIVSPHEANVQEGRMSIKSPIAHALLGKKAGENVKVRVPSGVLTLHIDAVEAGG